MTTSIKDVLAAAEAAAAEAAAIAAAIPTPSDPIVAALVGDATSATSTALAATFVTFRNSDGSPVVGKNVVITLTPAGTDIQDITVEAI